MSSVQLFANGAPDTCRYVGLRIIRWHRSRTRSAARGVGVAPGSLERQPPGVRGKQLMNRFWSPAAGGIKPNRRRCFEERYRHLPQPLDTLGGRKQRVVAAHRVEDQALIGLKHI